MARAGLSKSKIMAGLQCPRRLWLETYRPELVVYGPAQERTFAQGHDVGRLAREMHPGGILVGAAAEEAALRAAEAAAVAPTLEQTDGERPAAASARPPRGWLAAAQRETADLLAGDGDVILYEATFVHQGVLVRTDVLERRGGRVVVTEVKASTSVKDQHVTDAAVQAWVITRSGLRLHGVRLATLDRDWIYGGNSDYTGLLTETDVSGRVHMLLPEIPGIVMECRRILAGPLPPAPAGRHCHSPYECPLVAYCRRESLGGDGDGQYHVDLLPRGGRVVEQLQAEGYIDLRDVPADRLYNLDHLRVWQATCSGDAELDPALGELLRALPYPRAYLDFETVACAVPHWPGTHPWQVVPFQFSCHIEHRPETTEEGLDHIEFLDTSGDDPTPDCAAALLEALEASPGPILTYGSFERQRLEEMAAACPDLASRLLALADRIVDLHPLVQQHYYHPAMRGSWSLKAVLPTVAPDLDYAALGEVCRGDEAQAAYEEAAFPETGEERRCELRQHLLAYCALDTLALVRLVRYFEAR
jgi:hypothetical protein